MMPLAFIDTLNVSLGLACVVLVGWVIAMLMLAGSKR